jgi:hypothetical protein
VVDRKRLLERLEIPNWNAHRCWYDESLKEILRAKLFRECQPFWSSSLAVGDADWVGLIADRTGMKRYDVVGTKQSWLESVKSFFLRAQNTAKEV